MLYFVWPLIYLINIYQFNLPYYINRNYISFLHSISCTYLSYKNINNFNNFKYISHDLSISYFIWDIIYIIYYNYKFKRLKELPYIYHHLVCIFALNQLHYNNTFELTEIFFYGEISNFLNYIVYFLIKKKYKSSIFIYFKIIQIIWFSYFRFYIFSYILYNNFFIINNRLLAYNLLIIYLIGLFWGFNQINNFINIYINHNLIY